jgi:hypothetical protein
MTTTCYLLAHIVATNKLSNDAGLVRELGARPPNICRLRKEKLPLGATMISAIDKRIDMPIENIKALADVHAQERHSQVGN